jgi:putative oxidoreductase
VSIGALGLDTKISGNHAAALAAGLGLIAAGAQLATFHRPEPH